VNTTSVERARGASRALPETTTLKRAMDTNAVIVAVLVALSFAAAFVALGIAIAS